MPDQLIWIPIALVLPALVLGYRARVFERRLLSWSLIGIGFLAVALVIPAEGMTPDGLELTKGGIATAAAWLLFARSRGQGWATDTANFRRGLVALTTLAALTYLNFGAFHGQRSFLHLHDLAHYYLGAKYYPELGPADLYIGMLRAESEWTEDRFRSIEARDLENDQLVHIRELLQQSEPIKAAFSESRWEQFQRDVAFFRDALGPLLYATLLRDHGFNATPVWALFGHPLASATAPARDGGLLPLALLDPILLGVLFGAIGWAFGVEALGLALLYFCIAFGAGFAWTGGSFLRFPWLVALVGFACCLKRERHAAAGALLALSAGLRVFPLFFAVPLLARAYASFRKSGSLPSSHRAFLAGFAASGCLLVAATGLLPRGFEHWSEARARLSLHAEVLSPNLVGLTQLLAARPAAGLVTRDELRSIRERREDIHRVQLWWVALPVMFWVVRRARDRSELGSLPLAVPAIFASLSLASYYGTFLMLLVLLARNAAGLLALLFALEAASTLPLLVGASAAVQHVVRSALLALLCGLLIFDRRWRLERREERS